MLLDKGNDKILLRSSDTDVLVLAIAQVETLGISESCGYDLVLESVFATSKLAL